MSNTIKILLKNPAYDKFVESLGEETANELAKSIAETWDKSTESQKADLLKKANSSVIDRDPLATSELNEIVAGEGGIQSLSAGGLILIGIGFIIIGAALL